MLYYDLFMIAMVGWKYSLHRIPSAYTLTTRCIHCQHTIQDVLSTLLHETMQDRGAIAMWHGVDWSQTRSPPPHTNMNMGTDR